MDGENTTPATGGEETSDTGTEEQTAPETPAEEPAQ